MIIIMKTTQNEPQRYKNVDFSKTVLKGLQGEVCLSTNSFGRLIK